MRIEQVAFAADAPPKRLPTAPTKTVKESSQRNTVMLLATVVEAIAAVIALFQDK
jgi:hypothetical protein